MADHIKEMRLKRDNQQNANFFLIAFLLIFGTPMAVISAYYMVGWQLAIMLLPVLYWALFRAQALKNSKKQKKSRPLTMKRIVLRSLWYGALFVLPTWCVATDNVSPMRYWAYLLAVMPSITLVSRDGRSGIGNVLSVYDMRPSQADFLASTLFAGASLAFVLTSDLIWLFVSLTVWIWFHAFAVIIGFGITLSAFFGVPRLLGYKMIFSDDPKIIRGKPPKPSNPANRNRYTTQHVRWDGAVRDFKDLTIDQAITMFRRVRWNKELEKQPTYYEMVHPWKQPEMPRFHTSFGAFENLIVRAEYEGTFQIDCTFPIKGKSIFPPTQTFKTAGVPELLVPEIMRLAWIAQWEEVQRRLTPYRFELD